MPGGVRFPHEPMLINVSSTKKNAALGYTNYRELTVNYRKFSMKEKRFMENSRSIHGNLRSSTQWKQRNYYFVELTLINVSPLGFFITH